MAICLEKAVPLAFHLCCFYFSAVLIVGVPFPFGVYDWISIVSFPGHCLCFYFNYLIFVVPAQRFSAGLSVEYLVSSECWILVYRFAVLMHWWVRNPSRGLNDWYVYEPQQNLGRGWCTWCAGLIYYWQFQGDASVILIVIVLLLSACLWLFIWLFFFMLS